MKISLFNYSMFGYIAPITASFPHILSIEEILVQPISLTLIYMKYFCNVTA